MSTMSHRVKHRHSPKSGRQLRPPRTNQPGRARGCPNPSTCPTSLRPGKQRTRDCRRLQSSSSTFVEKPGGRIYAKLRGPLEHVLTQGGPRMSLPQNSTCHQSPHPPPPSGTGSLGEVRCTWLLCPREPCAEQPRPHVRLPVGEGLRK